MIDDISSVPNWVVDIKVSIAKIEGLTSQIPALTTAVEDLKANTVPMKEHLELMNRVEQLWNRDLSARNEWEEMTRRVPILWEDRVQGVGARRGYRVTLTVLSVVVTILTVLTLLRGLGVNVPFRP